MIFSWQRMNFPGRPFSSHTLTLATALIAMIVAAGCKTAGQPGQFEARRGDEILVAGTFVHTGTPVVLWMDPSGYDAYRVERRFAPYAKSDWSNTTAEVKGMNRPQRFGMRDDALTPEEIE